MEIRIRFREELDELQRLMLETLELVERAVNRTTVALRDQDAEVGREVIAADDPIDALYLEIKRRIFSLLARQTPVASDLRLVGGLLDSIGHAERMGDQCVNIAKHLPFGGEPHQQSEAMLACLVEMGGLAAGMTRGAREVFESGDATAAEALARQDDGLDALNRQVFKYAVHSDRGGTDHEWALHATLAARAFERIGDLAVDIGEEVAFIATGEFREFTDASHPGGVTR